MSKFQIASMVATGALFTLQGCNDDKPGPRKSCGDFTSQGQKACVANGNGKCQWADKGAAVCEPNSKFDDHFDKHEDACKKYGGSMQYTYKSKCDANTLKTIDWNEAKELTTANEVSFLNPKNLGIKSQGYLVDRCVGTMRYTNNVVEISITGGDTACQNGLMTSVQQGDWDKYQVVHATNAKACTDNGCAIDGSGKGLKCVEPGVICEAANQNKDMCSLTFCAMEGGASDMGGVPTCFTTDKSAMCDTFSGDSAPQYCAKTDKQTCQTPHAHGKYGGMCTMNGQDAANKTCVLLDGNLKTTSGADLASNLCTFKPSTDGECYGQL